tara:strand:+ start:577 stop:1263 length:687 start_codon:yes stop_codon:yes gene_type:complete
MHPKKTILFDLDGTLLDSAPDITLALNKALMKNQLNPIDESIVRNLIGNGSAELIARVLNRKTKKANHLLHKKIHEDFLIAYKKQSYFFSKLYADVQETLGILYQSFSLVCLTNKPSPITHLVLNLSGLAASFRLIISGDTLKQMKPSPVGVNFCIKNLKCKREDMIIVGDSAVDIKTAAAAGVKAIGVTYGYSHDIDLATEGADETTDKIKEIPRLVRKLLSKTKEN